jgi:Mrp family chromosome partitioning ATPase
MASGMNLPMDGLEPDASERGWRLPGRRPVGRRLPDGLAGLAEEPDQPDGDGPRRFAASRRATLPAGQGQAGAGAAAGGAQAVLPAVRGVALSADFVQLHYAIEALRSEGRPIVLQFVSASAGEGTSTVAAGFAAVAASERPGAVLVVSCGESVAQAARALAGGARRGTDSAPAGMPSLIEAVAAGQPAAAAVWRSASCRGLLRARLGVSAHPLMEIGSGALRRLLNGLGESYATVVLDCAPATSPDSAALSRHCDGTVLVVRAGVARVAAIDKARTAVERAGGHVVGVVLNRRRRPLPSWLERLL